MLFILDESVASLFADNRATERDLRSLEILILGALEGNHRVTGSRSTLRDLVGYNRVPEKSRATLLRAYNRIATEGQLHKNLTVHARVIAGESRPPQTRINNGQRSIILALQWFDSSRKIQPNILLGEHLYDARAIERIGRASSLLLGLKIPFNATLDHGGGSAIATVLADHVSKGLPSLCIVDSDRACPLGNKGGTAVSVERFNDAFSYPLVEVLETVGRDLENALPNYFYGSKYRGNGKYAPLVSLLEKLTLTGDSEIRAHVDIQHGLNVGHIFNFVTTSPEAAYWRSNALKVMNNVGSSVASFACWNVGVCASSSSGACCSCVVVGGIGANVLDHFCDHFDQIGIYAAVKQLDPSLRDEWIRLGHRVISWCCADEPLRI